MSTRRRGRTVDEWNSVSPSAAARFLGVSRQTVYTWIADGTLSAYRMRGARAPLTGKAPQRILRADLERLRRKRDRMVTR